MKKFLLILTVLVGAIVSTSCEGPQGPQGPPGPADIPVSYEIKINFNNDSQDNDSYSFPHPVRLYQGDIIMVYMLDGTENNGNPIWRQLPLDYNVTKNGQNNQIRYFNTWDSSRTTIFVNADTNLGWFRDTPTGSYTKGMIYRITYIPGADPIQKFSANTDNTPLTYDEMVEKYNLQDMKVHKMY